MIVSNIKKHAPKDCCDKGEVTLVGVLFSSVIIAVASTVSLVLINSALDASAKLYRRASVSAAITSRMNEIREKEFNLYCTSGCFESETDSIDNNLQYDTSAIEDDCTNQSFGSSLEESLENNNPDLTNDFNVQDYDQNSNSIVIDSEITASGNTLIVTLSESESDANTSRTFVPYALGWCE